VSPLARPLSGCVVNLSVSESDDSAGLGFPAWQVNRVTLQIVSALYGQGASVVFGHDWRVDGVMEAVHGFARQMQPLPPLSSDDTPAAAQPLLRNVIPWPDRPSLPAEDLERLASTLRVEPAGLPDELNAAAEDAIGRGPESPQYRYVRARGLTFLRHRLDEISDARLCVGGRRAGSAGRYPGVIEEAFLAVTKNKPLYVAGLLGGASHQVAEGFEGRPMPGDFCPAPVVAQWYEQPPITERDQASWRDRQIDRDGVWTVFRAAGLGGIARANRLTVAENEELFHTPVIDRVVELLLTGLSRLRATA
jgi:hypothetical protein